MLHRLASRVLNRPLLILPHTAEIICSVLAERIGVEPMAALPAREPKPAGNRFLGDPVVAGNNVIYNRVGNTGVVTVEGEMVNRGAWLGADSGLTSYEGISTQLMAAAKDPKVSRILLDIESPGGEAVGAMELAAMVRKINKEKPVYAIANGMAASAAYALASGASRLFTTPSAVTGSIGVVLLHLDRSAQMEKRGIKPTLIFAGAHKVDGHPFGPLPDSVADDLKAEVNQYYQHFVETVSQGRAGMTEQAIRATEGRVFIGADAVKTGLADAVATFDEVLAEIPRAGSALNPVTKGRYMSQETTGVPAAVTAGFTQADLDAARAAGAKAAQDRIAAILALDEAKTRAQAAQHIAFKTSMSVDDAKAMLAATAEETAKATPSLEARMSRHADAGPSKPDVAGDGGTVFKPDWNKHIARVNARVAS